MREHYYHFVGTDTLREIEGVTDQFGCNEQSPQQMFTKLEEILPVEKTNPSTWKARVEGFYHVSDNFFNNVLTIGQARYGEDWNRSKVIQEAKLFPFSHYHWLTGSREPIANMLTRDDYLNDPCTALIKLEDDILSLGGLLKKVDRRAKPRAEEVEAD